MSAESEPSVDVAVVNWNTPEAALAGGAAYAASSGVEARVVVVDNDSLPAQRRRLEPSPPGVAVLLRDENGGYGAAANEVLGSGSAEFVCASNSDVSPAPDMLRRLVDACADPAIGLAAPVLEPQARGYHTRLPSPGALLVRPFAGSFGQRRVGAPAPTEVRDVEQPAGACLLASRATWEGLGGFDAGFFLFYEDVDLARRSLDAGLRNVVVGAARARHVGAEAISGWDPREHQRQRLLSLRRYVGKHHPRLAPPANRLIAVALRVRARPR